MSYDAKINQALCDPLISAKRLWGIVKSMYGNKYYLAVPAISEDGILVSDPKKKPIFLISILRVKLVFLILTLLKFHFYSAARRIPCRLS